MIGSALGWGTHYLLMSTEFHRLATAVTMELPTLKMCLEGQQRWLDMLRSVLDFCLLHAAKAGTIDAPVIAKHGRELVDWKKAAPAPPSEADEDKDEDKQDQPRTPNAERRTPVREMEPQDVLAQAEHHAAAKAPDGKATKDKSERGNYVISMPEILDRDRLPNIQAIEAAAAAGHLTPQQAAREVMNTLGFSEIGDAMREWEQWVNLKADQITQDAQQAQDLQHKALAAKAGPAQGTAGPPATAKPKSPSDGADVPSGGLSGPA